MKGERILLAGSTGYLGQYIARQLIQDGFQTRLIARNMKKLEPFGGQAEIAYAEVTKPETLKGLFREVDTVISTVGITRQKDGLTYMDVDYQANMNLLDEAKANGVRKMIYVSVLNGEKLSQLKICDAKEKFADALKASGMEYCIIRPNGYFSDMEEFLAMAKRGRVYLFGDGEYKLNPIHGADLARVCLDAMGSGDKEMDVGGPEVMTQNEIAALALQACSKKARISHLPDWTRRAALGTARFLTSSKTYGPVEFFLTTMAMDMVAPCYGNLTLSDFFKERAKAKQ